MLGRFLLSYIISFLVSDKETISFKKTKHCIIRFNLHLHCEIVTNGDEGFS